MSEPLIQTPSIFGDNGNFLLERELGSGGMGGVYMGRDKMLDRPVAVKVMLKEYGADNAFLEKFKKEAQAAARLIHPNIVQVYSYGVSEGMPYMAMELAAGGSLYTLMTANPGKTDIQRVLKICQQTAQALQCASDQGVIHGDVKPENILFDANGNAKLADFGLAGMQKDTNEIWGTPYYISPEKVRKEAIDFRADMYSLGGTLYHALTGVAPFEGEDSVAVVRKRFEGVPRKPSSIRPEISPAIDTLVMRMLALSKDERYPSFEALLNAFQEVLTSGLTSAAPASAQSNAEPKSSARGKKMVLKKKPSVRMSKPKIEASSDGEEEDEEASENIGGKVVLVVVGVILLIGAIIGGLIWYQKAAAAAREREFQQSVVSKGTSAREAIKSTRVIVEKFEAENRALAQDAVAECERLTAELAKLLPESANDFKPGPSKELKDAEAKLAAAEKPAETDAAAATNAVEQVETPAIAEESSEPKEYPPAVLDMRDLWNRAYGCQASQINLQLTVKKIYQECDSVADTPIATKEDAEKLGSASVAVKDLYEQMSASKDVETLRKGLKFIKSKGQKIIDKTVKELKIAKAKAEREEAARLAAEKEAERLRQLEEAKKALIEKETTEIATKFDTIAAQGCFRQLDWVSATRQLKSLSDEFKSEEGKLAAEFQQRKVERMKAVQNLFIAKLPNYVFKAKIKHPLRGAKIVKINDKEIAFQKLDNKTAKISWQKFYRDCPGHLNEVVNHFIVNGRKNSGLNLRDWADSMTGAALTMRLVCESVNGAKEKAEQLAKEVYQKYEDYQKILKETFPDISFAEVTTED